MGPVAREVGRVHWILGDEAVIVPGLQANQASVSCSIEGVSAELRTVEIELQESLSQPFVGTVTIASPSSTLNLEDIVGKNARIEILDREGATSRYLHGVIALFEQAGSTPTFSLYRAQIVPRVRLLAYRHDCRVFKHKSSKDIIKDVLDGASIPSSEYRIALEGDYQPREYCAQYRESDLNFISRLMEEEGIA